MRFARTLAKLHSSFLVGKCQKMSSNIRLVGSLWPFFLPVPFHLLFHYPSKWSFARFFSCVPSYFLLTTGVPSVLQLTELLLFPWLYAHQSHVYGSFQIVFDTRSQLPLCFFSKTIVGDFVRALTSVAVFCEIDSLLGPSLFSILLSPSS